MTNTNLQFKTSKIVFTDYYSFFLALCSILVIFGGPVAIFFWLFLIPMLLKRTAMIKSILKTGQTTQAKIVKHNFFKHGSTLYYEYEINGQKYTTKNSVKKRSLIYQLGQLVEIKYHPQIPKKAFIIDLYSSSPKN